MSGGRAHSKNVSWSKPQEPSFLKAFKEKVGYREPSTIDAKHEARPPPSVEDREDREDELPTVVVLRPGDVSKEEFVEYRKSAKEKEDNDTIDDSAGGKIMFKKPTKRKSSEAKALDASTSKKAKPNQERSSNRTTHHQKKTKSKGVMSKSLLSFDDDEQ